MNFWELYSSKEIKRKEKGKRPCRCFSIEAFELAISCLHDEWGLENCKAAECFALVSGKFFFFLAKCDTLKILSLLTFTFPD